jgi:preprotein translocase subunit SecA
MKGIVDDLYGEYSNLMSNICAFRYDVVTNSDRDKLIDRIKSFIESNSEVQQKTLNENRDIEGLQLFIEVLFEFKVVLETMSINKSEEQLFQNITVNIIECVVAIGIFLCT